MTQRGSGITTRQMIDAPVGSIYVIPGSGSLGYMKGLAEFLGRTDLKLTIPGFAYNSIRGTKKHLTIDHAVWDIRLTHQDNDDLNDATLCASRNATS